MADTVFGSVVRKGLILILLFLISPAQAETRALLIGVWKFESASVPDLKGPENDLGAMETLVRAQGATDVTVLRNDQVTRTTIETALHALGLRSKPGDWVVFYYSGHGAQAEAAVKGTRDGDLDQFVPLTRFDPEVADAERYVVDKDFYTWLARYLPQTVQILMIADTCHSGSLNRSADRRAFHFTPRLALAGAGSEIQLAARPAPRFPTVLDASVAAAGAGGADRADLPNLVYLAAAQDGQLALEAALPVEGAPSRGLLTYAFEQGLTAPGADGRTLAADLDGDGRVAVGEIATYLDAQVRALTAQRQEPRAAFVTGREAQPLFATVRPTVTAPAEMLPAVFATDPAGAAALRSPESPWRVAPAAGAADFVWDVANRAVVRRSGDVIAEGVASVAQLRGVVEKWNAVATLRPLLDESRARLEVRPAAGRRHAPGAQVDLALTAGPGTGAGTAGYATVFNIASDGTVQRLYPLAAADGEGRLAAGATVPLIENRVVAPYGADHVVAVITPDAPVDLRALLRAVDGQRAAGRLVAPIRAALARAGTAGLSIGEIYTGR